MNIFTEAAREAALKAGLFLREHFNKANEVHYKGPGHGNPASSADVSAEEIILNILRRRFPDHAFISEECGRSGGRSEYSWFIDPLDGTVNFIHGYRNFAVSIATSYRDETVAGIIYNPMSDELFRAEKGNGAYLDDRRMRVSAVTGFGKSLTSISFPYERDSADFQNSVSYFGCLSMQSQAVRRDGSTALALCNVACGRFDGFCVAGNQPWDYAAGVLIVAEAGGRVSDFSGNPIQVESGEVLATNGHIHESMMKCLAGAR